MNILLNIIWFVFDGLMIAIEHAISSVHMMLTVSSGWSSGCLAGLINVIWWFVGGLGIALTHLCWGIIFCITLVGIPFGLQHFKLMRLALFPFGKSIN